MRSTPHWSCQFLVLERFPRGKRDRVSSMGCQHNREEAKAGITPVVAGCFDFYISNLDVST